MNEYINNDEDAVRERRLRRMQEMQRRKRQQMMIRRYSRIAVPLMVVLVVMAVLVGGKKSPENAEVADEKVEQSQEYAAAEHEETEEQEEATGEKDKNTIIVGNKVLALQTSIEACTMSVQQVEAETQQQEQPETELPYAAQETAGTRPMNGDVVSSYGIFLNSVTGDILAQRNATTRMNPASMTKVLTVLVAAEHVENLDDTIAITPEISDYGYINDCSAAGFVKDEIVTVKDLFYGTILPSGAEAAMGLAVYVAGDHETFVEMMNQKLEELGLSQTTHVTNCVGVYDENHYSTAYDMAMIMEAALDNELCREVMAAHTFTTSVTEQHPEGIILSNWFLRRIEDRDTGGEVICAKTGYVNEAGSCAVSYGKDMTGNEYICVTADAENQWKCIKDHEVLYKMYAEEEK